MSKQSGQRIDNIDEDILEATEIIYWLNLGVSITEQGYKHLDDDLAIIIKNIKNEEYKKTKNNNGGNKLNGRF